jgi:hypothetical protein
VKVPEIRPLALVIFMLKPQVQTKKVLVTNVWEHGRSFPRLFAFIVSSQFSTFRFGKGFHCQIPHRPLMPNPDSDAPERNLGPQPLDALMTGNGLDNHALVAASPEPLTHKAVQRARKGRRLTPHMKLRIAAAVNRALIANGTPPEKELFVRDLFTY